MVGGTISFKFKKSLGQNFLSDGNLLSKEVSVADITGLRVVEIGPGDGRLTKKIAAANPRSLTLIEMDARLIEGLKSSFPDASIIHGDVLEVAFPPCDVVIGNIPYYISSQIIFKLKELPIKRAVLMVQKEFAQKMIALPNTKEYGRLSVTAQLSFDITYVQTVKRHLFKPVPRVDSALILIIPRGRHFTAAEDEFLRALFSHKNRTLRNALSSGGYSDEMIAKFKPWLERRARTLSPLECESLLALIS